LLLIPTNRQERTEDDVGSSARLPNSTHPTAARHVGWGPTRPVAGKQQRRARPLTLTGVLTTTRHAVPIARWTKPTKGWWLPCRTGSPRRTRSRAAGGRRRRRRSRSMVHTVVGWTRIHRTRQRVICDLVHSALLCAMLVDSIRDAVAVRDAATARRVCQPEWQALSGLW